MNKITHRILGITAALALTLGCYQQAFASTALRSDAIYQQSSNTYYVATDGDDSNPGSADAPFLTFSKAVSVLQAGDVLQVMDGTYNETLTVSVSGTQDAPITITSRSAVLNLKGAKSNGIVVNGSYVNVSGFEVSGATEFGIIVSGANVIIENNVVHDNVTRNGVGTCGLSSSWGSALKVRVGGANTIIRNNTVFNNCGEGIAVTRGVTALLENNTVYDNYSVNLYVDNSPYVTVQNNTIYCTGTYLRDGKRPIGIALGEEAYSGWGAQLHDILISDNSIADCHTGIAAFHSNVDGTLTNLTIDNNNVPGGQVRSISLQSASNQNVVVSNNSIFNNVYVNQPDGVTLTGNIVNGTVSTPSTPTPAPATPAPIVPMQYDDKDPAITYSAGWQNVFKRAAYGGSFKQTGQNGAYATLTFTGQTFSILYKSGTAYRSLNVYVDDVLVGTINQRSATTTFQSRWDYPGQLEPGSHVLKLVFVTTKASGGTYGSLDAILTE